MTCNLACGKQTYEPGFPRRVVFDDTLGKSVIPLGNHSQEDLDKGRCQDIQTLGRKLDPAQDTMPVPRIAY